MRCKILAALFFLLTLNSLAQNLEIYSPPMPSQPGYNDLFGYQGDPINLLAEPHVNGLTIYYPWGSVDSSGNPLVPSTRPCTEPTCQWTTVDSELLAYINGPNNAGGGIASHPGQTLNLIIEMVPESGSSTDSTVVPGYVYLPSTYTGPPTGWCPNCAAQDQVTCGTTNSGWTGDQGAPTCHGGTPGSTQQCGASGSNTTIQPGVWNYNQCHLTGVSGTSCGTGPFTDVSGYPVLYEQPLMTAYEAFVDAVIKHYSPSGGAYNTIGKYIGYIRVGLASGGENLPVCTSTGSGSNSKGVWPSPQGLTYDLTNYGGLGPDWFATTYPCTTDPSCQGQYAYIDGSPNGITTDGTGYVATVFAAFQASLTKYTSINPLYKPYIMASAHSGPPQSEDSTWADDEAKIFMKWPCRNCEQSGFGDQSLNEYDLLDDSQDPCTNDWCNLFSMYMGYGGNLYLQTTVPNDFATIQISGIDQSTQVATCNQCTSQANFSGQYGGLYNGEGFALPDTVGPKDRFKIAANGVINGNTFSLDSSTKYDPNSQHINFPATLYVGDYLPDTIPFAAAHFANTIEVYFCDWEFAYNPASASVACQPHDPTATPVYANILSNP